MIDISIQKIIQISKDAGEKILSLYHNDAIDIWQKADHSPLTEADLMAHRTIVSQLKRLTPDIPIISEESVNETYQSRANWPCFWLVDPLDGTKSFLKRSGQFTVNIALINDHQPILGVIYAPVDDKIYYAVQNKGAYRQIGQDKAEKLLTIPRNSLEPLRIIVSASHGTAETESFIEQFTEGKQAIERIAMGSSLKFCLVAEGRADIYPRLAPTMEWDTAAGQIIVSEAGKSLTVLETGEPLQYNKQSLRNPSFIVK